jgi:hypothetical protein
VQYSFIVRVKEPRLITRRLNNLASQMYNTNNLFTVPASFNLDGANAAVEAFRNGVLQTDEELQAAQGTILNTIA